MLKLLSKKSSQMFPFSVCQLSAMKSNHFDCNSIGEEDTWFFGGDVDFGNLGSVLVHVVPRSADMLWKSKAFVDYCNSNPEAFDKYKNTKVKLSGENELMLPYKKRKFAVVTEIIKEAVEWYQSQQQDKPADSDS